MAETGQYIQDGSVTWVVTDIRNTTLVGSITMYAGTTTPAGYLVCDGSAISRTDYKTLFDVIGTAYGEGDGDSTFNLPLLTDNRFAEFSATPAAAKDAGLPNISSSLPTMIFGNRSDLPWSANTNFSRGCCSVRTWSTTGSPLYGSGTGWDGAITLSASYSSAIYGNSATVQPLSLTLIPLVRYI